MKAIRFHSYGLGDGLVLEDVETPVPTEDRVLVRVKAASVNSWDWDRMRGRPLWGRAFEGWRRPKNQAFGCDLAGIVEAVGPAVTDYSVGDEVIGDIAWFGFGAFAEYAAVRQQHLARKSGATGFVEGAAVPQAGLLALQGMRLGRPQAGESVLVNGAGGGVGTFAVQMAKAVGAEVTGVDRAMKEDLIRSLGADHFVDFERQDYTRIGRHYDFILDMVARHSVFTYHRCLAPGGRLVMVGGALRTFVHVVPLGRLVSRGDQAMKLLGHRPNRADLEEVNRLIEAGEVRPVVERTFPLDEATEAVRHVGEGRALGKVVVIV